MNNEEDKDHLVCILSDVHGNDAALEVCLNDARCQARQLGLPLSFWFLGDVANGLPGVRRCLMLLGEAGSQLREWLIGNHDLAQLMWWPASGQHFDPIEECHKEAVLHAARPYIKDQLDRELLAEDITPLEDLRRCNYELWQRWVSAPTWKASDHVNGAYLAHGLIVSPDTRDPVNTLRGLLDTPRQDYLNGMLGVIRSVSGELPYLVATGHTHLPDIWARNPSGQWSNPGVVDAETACEPARSPKASEGGPESFAYGKWRSLDRQSVWVINVGSVGMQRNHKAGTITYALLRVDRKGCFSLCFKRLRYDCEKAIREWRKHGWPERVLSRVEKGY